MNEQDLAEIQRYYGFSDSDMAKLQESLANVRAIEASGDHIYDNFGNAFGQSPFKAIKNVLKRGAEDTVQGIGDFYSGLLDTIGLKTEGESGQNFKDGVSKAAFGKDANIGRYNISMETLNNSTVPNRFKRYAKQDLLKNEDAVALALLSDLYSRASKSVGRENGFVVASAAFNKPLDVAINDFKEGKLSYYGRHTAPKSSLVKTKFSTR